ncbi:winged helix-turn-helix domain-containing protein [Streptomyces sp. NPDC051677]|uniref:winged helix-turn-helix domain-containing protein n=1 Tax=Streptomyces sp. NPDC051677 TaxID=3365669 RepID=UPI0037D5F774
MRAVHRRKPRIFTTGTAAELHVCGRVVVNRRSRRVFLDEAQVALRPKEFALLEFLTDQLGVLIPREAIMAAVWDSNWFGSTRTLDVHVAALRSKFGGALRIECVRGVGFRTTVGTQPDCPCEAPTPPLSCRHVLPS